MLIWRCLRNHLGAKFRRQVCNSGEARRFNDEQQQGQTHSFSRSSVLGGIQTFIRQSHR